MILPSTLLSAARTRQEVEDSLGSPAGSLISGEQKCGRKSLVLDTRVLRSWLGPGTMSTQSRYIPRGGFLLSQLCQVTWIPRPGLVSASHISCVPSALKASPSTAFPSVTAVSDLALNLDEICPVHSLKKVVVSRGRSPAYPRVLCLLGRFTLKH